MWEQIDQLKKKVDQFRPLRSDIMKVIAQKLHEDWTFHTNAIEGNTFTYQETAFFLREGLTVKGKTLREHLEIVNHMEAINYLEEIVKERDLSERLIKDFHAILFQGVKGIAFSPGDYKKADNHVLTVNGETHKYCSYLLVPEEIERLISWYSDQKGKLHPIELAALFHHRLVSIHPFTDGNGRVSRLSMNFILIKNGYPPAIIRNENRFEYYQSLEEADSNHPDLFIQLIADEVERSLIIMTDYIN